MAAMSDFLENNLVDFLLRGQAFVPGTARHVALFTTATDDAVGGTEVTGGAYARSALAASLTNWAGTQAAGSTTVSTGSGGATSNNVTITFPAPTANWGVVTHFAVFDAATAGNRLFHGVLTASKTINSGDAAPTYPPGTMVITFG